MMLTNPGELHPTRRAFLSTALCAGAVSALPGTGLAAKLQPTVQTLAFDGDTLLSAGTALAGSANGGRSWINMVSPGAVVALATHPRRPGRILAGLAAGGVALSDDGGATWRDLRGGLPAGAVGAIAIAARDPDMFYAAISGDGLWKSGDAGESWTFVMDRPWLKEAEHDLLTLASVDLASGMGGIWIYAGTEVGLTRVPDCFCRWQDVQPGNALDALVAGGTEIPHAPLPDGEPVLAMASAPSAPSSLYAALPSGVWASGDGGVIWENAAEGPASAVAVHPDDEEHVAAIIGGELQISRDAGASWALATT